MKLAIYSDLHLEWSNATPQKMQERVIEIQKAIQPADVIVLAGDIHCRTNGVCWAAETFPDKPVVMVAGNHEFYRGTLEKEPASLRAEASATPQVHYLENEAIEINGVMFIGCTLWTDFALQGIDNRLENMLHAQMDMEDYAQIRSVRRGYKMAKAEHTLELHQSSVRWLCESLECYRNRKIVVVTHHAPSARSIPEQHRESPLNPAFASNLEWMMEQYQPVIWIHGHTHGQADYHIAGTRVIANCLGYPDEPCGHSFNPHLLVEI